MATNEQTDAAIRRVGAALEAGRQPSAADLTLTQRAASQEGDRGSSAKRALGDPKGGSWGILGS